jgi:transglutaminase-like putative cysteine protease
MDLSHAGPVHLGAEEAFQVRATDDRGRPADDLPPDQRWRGGVLDSYDRGQWTNRIWSKHPDLARLPPSVDPPPLAHGQRALLFNVHARANSLVLAEPLRAAGPAGRRTLVTVEGGDPFRLVVSSRGPVLPHLDFGSGEYTYRQAYGPVGEPGRAAADEEDDFDSEALSRQDVPGMAEWIAELMRRLAADPHYAAYALRPAPPGERIPPERWEATAQALTGYLSSSGDYTYTLDLRRADGSIDPTLDFLQNVKAGHCERYASGLALMLRAQGIPCRVVVGYRGAEAEGGGVYRVRQNQAHAWVEVLVPHRRVDAEPRLLPRLQAAWEWLAVDPTPASDGAAPPFSMWEWWQDGSHTGERFWGDLIVHFGSRQQAAVWAWLTSPAGWMTLGTTAGGVIAAAGSAALAWLALRRRGRTGRRPRAAADGYAQLRALLAKGLGLRPRTGQTPREFAVEAAAVLRTLPAAAALAGVPEETVAARYRVRFGGQKLSTGEEADLTARLDQLAAALRGSSLLRRSPAPA